MKRLSIITICYNSENTIRRTIESVLKQKNENVEYIIIDGGSKDSTMSIIDEYKNQIDYVISEPDNGISDAFNKGVRVATGEWVGIINSDDYYLPNAFNVFFKEVKETSDVFYGNGVRAYSDNSFKKFLSNSDTSELFKSMSIVHPSTFVRKSAYLKFGLFNEKFRTVMDRELLLRMLTGGATFQYIDEYISVYSMGGMSDKNYYKYVLPESFVINKEYNNTACGVSLYLKDLLLYLAVKIRDKMRLNHTFLTIDDVVLNRGNSSEN